MIERIQGTSGNSARHASLCRVSLPPTGYTAEVGGDHEDEEAETPGQSSLDDSLTACQVPSTTMYPQRDLTPDCVASSRKHAQARAFGIREAVLSDPRGHCLRRILRPPLKARPPYPQRTGDRQRLGESGVPLLARADVYNHRPLGVGRSPCLRRSPEGSEWKTRRDPGNRSAEEKS